MWTDFVDKLNLRWLNFSEWYHDHFLAYDAILVALAAVILIVMGDATLGAFRGKEWDFTWLQFGYLSTYRDGLFKNAADGCLTMLGFVIAAWSILISAGSGKSLYVAVATGHWRTIKEVFLQTTYFLGAALALSYAGQISRPNQSVVPSWILVFVLCLATARTYRCVWLLSFITNAMFADQEDEAAEKVMRANGMTEKGISDWKARRSKKKAQ